MWKFQPPSWKDSPTRYATPRKIHKVELRLFYFGMDYREGVTLQGLQFFLRLDHLSLS